MVERKTPLVRYEYCVMQYGCKNCVVTCPEGAIETIHRRRVAFIEPELCGNCGLCYQVCPTGAIEDLNAVDYRRKALDAAKGGATIIFICEHTDFNSKFKIQNSKFIPVSDISIVSWRDIFKVMTMGSPVVMVGCGDCRYTAHFRQLEEVFKNSCYEGAFRFYLPSPQSSPPPFGSLPFTEGRMGWGAGQGEGRFETASLDENILEQIITSYKGRLSFPGTAWVDIGKRCSLCQACANSCPTGALHIEKMDGRLSLMYDHNLCKGCPICEKVCPERCITIDRRVRMARLFSVEKRGEKWILLCRGCNRPLTTDGVFDRVKSILTAHGQPTDHLEYCPDCKARGVRLEVEDATHDSRDSGGERYDRVNL